VIIKASCLSVSFLGLFTLSYANAQERSQDASYTDTVAAIVEDISIGEVRPIQFDLLKNGTIIELGQGKIVLGYLQTCLQDTISNGRVRVGLQQSIVEGGFASSRRVECDSAGLAKTAGSPGVGRGLSVIGSPINSSTGIILYGRSPIIITQTPSRQVTIRPLDKKTAAIKIQLKNNRIDTADHGIVLLPDARYRVTNGTVEVDFRIDNLAETGKSPAVGRLLILQ